MPDSKIRQIIDVVKAQVELLSPLGARGSKLQHWVEVVDFPAVFTYFAGESKAMGPTQSVTSLARVGLYCVTKGSFDPSGNEDPLLAFLELYRQIVLNIEDDPTLGGLAMDGQGAMVTECLPMVTAETIARGYHVADVIIDVPYRHVRGTP